MSEEKGLMKSRTHKGGGGYFFDFNPQITQIIKITQNAILENCLKKTTGREGIK